MPYIGTCMTQNERLRYLLDALLSEDPRFINTEIPNTPDQQWRLLRSLMNVRPAKSVADVFIKIQNEYLSERIANQGIVDAQTLPSTANDPRIVVWKGDITTLRIDAIVNAANSRMEGCWQPCHACIDNCIHTFSGMQLRMRCHEMMMEQGHEEPTGQAKITPGYNLPAKHVLHTVGPIIEHSLTKRDCDLLASCYVSCLELAEENGCHSIAFCCISTGVFRFPREEAAEIAVQTVKDPLEKGSSIDRVVFNVFTSDDERIYYQLLG
jgi:O-acetyl-ADP-ribose deacetylase (regulator of RNase III)